MSIRENKQATFLIVLLVILGLTLFLAPRINRQPTASVAPEPEAGAETEPALAAVASDARIRLDLIDKTAQGVDAGSENLFQYRLAPTPPARPPAGFPDPFGGGAPAPSPIVTPARPVGPPPTPPPPPITLRYQGFARDDRGGVITAFLVDETNHFNVRTGDVLMGRFRIVGVTDTSVEVEDLQFNRRQNLPLLN